MQTRERAQLVLIKAKGGNKMRTYLYDIADTDERPRTDTEGNWLLTSLSIVLMLPTLIASFYGMNVDRIVNA